MPSSVSILVSLRTSTTTGLVSLQSALRGLENDASAGDRALKEFRGALIGLTPAAVPVAAALVGAIGPVVAQLGAATVAAGAFTAALIPQFKSISDTAKAQDKYSAAVGKSGAGSKQAAAAEEQYQDSLSSMPEVTRKAAAALGDLKNEYQGWSDSLADDTMPVAIKSFAVLEQIFPKLTPMVQASSVQFGRLIDVMGGATQTSSFDKLSKEFSDFANKSLKTAVDEALHFSRVLAQGDFNHGPFKEFLTYARENAPLVKDTLLHLEQALLHIGEAASNAGPGMLTVVNALAGLVSAIPAPVLTRMIQLYTAMRLIKGASAGVLVATSAIGRLDRAAASMGRAAVGAGGGLAGLRAALATLSTGTKVAGAIAVIAGVVLVMKQLASNKEAPPNVDRLTTALGNLGRTGKLSGEAARIFGKDFSDLNYAIGRLNGQASGMDKFNDTMNKVLSLGMAKSNSAKQAAKDIDAIDKGLANLVQGGHPDLAAAALKRLTDEYSKSGKPTSDLTSKLDAYKSALEDAKFEADLTAESQGLFGKQAQQVQKDLDAQKASADGLRQAIEALNDENRKGISAQSDFEQAIDDATAAVKDHHHALKMVDGQLDLNTQASRDSYKALADLATATDANGAAAREQGKDWQAVYEIYGKGRTKLIDLAKQMGLNKYQAEQLANQILKTPDKTAYLRGNIQDLQAKVKAAQASLKSAPSSKTTAIKANIAQLQNAIRDAQARIDSLTGKTVTIRTTYVSNYGNVAHEGGNYAHGGIVGAAGGGPRSRMTLVGEQGPELVDLAAGSRVHTANATRQLLSGASGGSTQPIVIHNTIELDGRVVAEQMLNPTRDLVQRVAGGDVQRTFGGRIR